MSTQNISATEYRNLPLSILTESKTNPRRTFEDAALKDLAESIRSQGVLSPLLVRPLNERSFEIVAGARRYSDSIPKLLSAYIRKADEGELGRLLMEMVILHAARTQSDGGKVLKEAAEHYKVDATAIALKVKQEFAAKEKARIQNKSNPKPPTTAAKKSTAA